MPTEIALLSGKVLRVADDNERPDDVIRRLGGRDMDVAGGFVSIATTEGDYRIRPQHVTSVRWVDA